MADRKPAERRHNRHTTDTGMVALPGGKRDEPPPPPSGLLKATRSAWEALWASNLAGLVELGSDRPALERLFRLYDERERVHRAVRKHGRLVTGSQGQAVLNPLLRHASDCEKEIRHLEDRFGLTPLARLRLGVTFGEAARSLRELNEALLDDQDDDLDDPRVEVVDVG